MQKLLGGPKAGCFLKVEEQNIEFGELKFVEEMEMQLYGKLLH